MTDAEELEMKRLCTVLGEIAGKNTDPAEIEALQKGALALHSACIHGHTSYI